MGTRSKSESVRTSIGERYVTVTFIGPACIVKIERVGVIWTLVTFPLLGGPASPPIQLYVKLSTLIFPDQPRMFYVHCKL